MAHSLTLLGRLLDKGLKHLQLTIWNPKHTDMLYVTLIHAKHYGNIRALIVPYIMGFWCEA